MIKPEQVGWGRYKNWRGPFWRGQAKFVLPENPTETDIIMDVISHTEGRYHDAYNGYDSCRCTISPIQVCERGQYSASALLGHLKTSVGSSVMKPLDDFGSNHGFTFTKDLKGRWRFRFIDKRGFVDREQEQTQLFWLHSSGKKDNWDPASKTYAKGMAASIINVMSDPSGFFAQREWLSRRVRLYAFKHAKTLVDEAPDTDIGRCLVAGLLSYCINNPSWAAKYSWVADDSWKEKRWTKPWLIHVFSNLTFGPKISLYRHRWNAIRPAMEKHFSFDLPDFAEELQDWDAGGSLSVEEAQFILRHMLFFELGPSGPNQDGVDGIYGEKTRSAVESMQRLCHLEVDGGIGKNTKLVLLGVRDAWDKLSEDEQKNMTATTKLDVLANVLET